MAHLFGHGSSNDLEQDFALLGSPPEQLMDSLKGDDFELWEENAEAFGVFLKLTTQWRHGMKGPTGLDYSGVVSCLQLLGIKSDPWLFEQIQTMERAALTALREE